MFILKKFQRFMAAGGKKVSVLQEWLLRGYSKPVGGWTSIYIKEALCALRKKAHILDIIEREK